MEERGRSKSLPSISDEAMAANASVNAQPDAGLDSDGLAVPADGSVSPTSTPGRMSRNHSFSASSSYQEDWEIPPLDRLTFFDLLDNLALSQKLEKWQQTLNVQRERVRRQREKLKSTSLQAKERVVGEWKKRVPTAEEQLEKYRRRMKESVERLGKQWNATATVTIREKISFIAGVLNIFISGYLIGAYPQYFYYWYTGQLIYFMPIRVYTYHKRGWHYFLADLCYFVNFLSLLSIWVFPRSKRLLISTYCLAYGNNAVAIAMWRNSMVFHSMEKVVSLFIHIMPPVVFHCLTHLTPTETLKVRFPAIYSVKFSAPGSPEHYTLWQMMLWASIPYGIWQLSYHIFISVRRRDKIAAGRPTSFTWLRRSYAKTWIGKFVLSLPEHLQEPAFMMIQYIYALLTMIPCPIWFWYRWGSSFFLIVVFIWSIYNGATYYIDVFGKRFQKELEQLKKDVAKWQSSPDAFTSPVLSPEVTATGARLLDETAISPVEDKASLDRIPPLDALSDSTGVELRAPDAASTLRDRTI
ncbi:hypothetical protein VTN77DRAFT_8382 [Rasamsonia byssochlamydoides]|uniref:uncharacterized protein n=1 Tax=Rasamsonia byssochlamydoides TaxID=89139 RepID=UPI003744A60B